MADALVFYTNPMSRGRIVRWMLEEVGADYRTEIVEYGPEMTEEPYRSINPMGKVPALTHGARVITETPAICAYLADAFPEAGLAPPVEERADYYRWLFFAAGPVEQAVTNTAMQFVPSAEQSRMAGYGTFEKVVDVLESTLTGRDYMAGGRFSAVDVYLGSHIGWGMQYDILPVRPVFEDYVGRIFARPARQRATEIDDALLAERA